VAKPSRRSQSDVPLDDPAALANFGKLEMVARLVVEGYMMGLHKSPFKGASVEFTEHRQYYPGDEIRHIDWRAYGKTGKYYVKEFEDETNLRCHLLVDGSGSMKYAGQSLSKFDYARQMAAALGYLLLSQRDAVGIATFDTKVRTRVEPSTNPKNFQLLTSALSKWKPGRETSLSSVIEELAPTLRRRSLIILISDLLDEYNSLITALKRLRHQRHEVILLHVVAPDEEDFPFRHPTQFRSLERAGQHKLADPHRLRSTYLASYQEFCRKLIREAGNAGIDYHKTLTSQPYHQALGAFLDTRTRRAGKK
jgi:uncharacterized protein (DUF58 family)